jgi:hypothetical protein
MYVLENVVRFGCMLQIVASYFTDRSVVYVCMYVFNISDGT